MPQRKRRREEDSVEETEDQREVSLEEEPVRVTGEDAGPSVEEPSDGQRQSEESGEQTEREEEEGAETDGHRQSEEERGEDPVSVTEIDAGPSVEEQTDGDTQSEKSKEKTGEKEEEETDAVPSGRGETDGHRQSEQSENEEKEEEKVEADGHRQSASLVPRQTLASGKDMLRYMREAKQQNLSLNSDSHKFAKQRRKLKAKECKSPIKFTSKAKGKSPINLN